MTFLKYLMAGSVGLFMAMPVFANTGSNTETTVQPSTDVVDGTTSSATSPDDTAVERKLKKSKKKKKLEMTNGKRVDTNESAEAPAETSGM